jgi:pyruvate formate lyase activating enzyme
MRSEAKQRRRALSYCLWFSFSLEHRPCGEKAPLSLSSRNCHPFLGTVGCNLSCKFCQNWEISQYPKLNNYKVFGEEYSPQEIVSIAERFKTPSISYTYNEPVIFFEFAYDIMKLAYERGIKNIFVSSGYETEEVLERSVPLLSAMNIDLKSFSDDFYQRICGARLKPVLKAIEKAYKLGIWIEITTLLIPGYNDSEGEIRAIARFIKELSPDIPWHISRFFPAYLMGDLPPTPVSTLKRAYEIGKEEGLRYVYVGNYADQSLTSTYCPSCGHIVIERSGYLGERVKVILREGKCEVCGFEIAGVWG